MTPQFIGVGVNEKVNLQDIKCNEEAEDLVALSTLDEVGNITATYNWTSVKGVGLCWVDASTMKIPTATIEFNPGEAFWVESAEGENVFQTSGQVCTKDIVSELTEGGATLIGNSFPVSVNLQDIVCNDEAEDLIALSTLDEVGNVTATYNWTSVKGVGLCWVDAATMKIPTSAVIFEAGEGFWVESAEGENTITFPGVEL